MNVVQHVYRLGGVTERATLVGLTSRREVDRALKAGEILRDGHGRYAVPVADTAQRAANALSGVVSHRSAALHWGWEVKSVPKKPDVTLPKNRKVTPERREAVALHRARLMPHEVDGRVTSRERTLADCLRSLPFDDALAIADSALRHGSLTKESLIVLAEAVRGSGAPQSRRVAQEATEKAANPFESVLRAIALDVEGLDLVPQVLINEKNISVRPDLVDQRRRVVAEADSFEWHGSRSALRNDCQRYTNLVVRGWLVVRFAWEDVMQDPDYVRRALTSLSEVVNRRTGRKPQARPVT